LAGSKVRDCFSLSASQADYFMNYFKTYINSMQNRSPAIFNGTIILWALADPHTEKDSPTIEAGIASPILTAIVAYATFRLPATILAISPMASLTSSASYSTSMPRNRW
jgi:hypothetical protein